MCRFVVLCFLLIAFKEAQGQSTQVTKSAAVADCVNLYEICKVQKPYNQYWTNFMVHFNIDLPSDIEINLKLLSANSINKFVNCTNIYLTSQTTISIFSIKSSTRISVRNNGILPINAYVEGCIEPPCLLPQLEDVVINVVFEAPYVLDNLTTKALAIVKIGILPIEVNYDLGANAITCNFLTNSSCPIQKNEVVQYTLKMYIESFFPAGTSVTIEFRVEDNDNLPVWCIRLPIKITKPRSKADINQDDQIETR